MEDSESGKFLTRAGISTLVGQKQREEMETTY